MVPKKIIRFVRLLDITTNGSHKKAKKRKPSNFIISFINDCILKDSNRTVTTILVDL